MILVVVAAGLLVQQTYSAQCLQQVAGLTHSEFNILNPEHRLLATRKADALSDAVTRLIDGGHQADAAYREAIRAAHDEEARGELPPGSTNIVRDEARASAEALARERAEFERRTSECAWPWMASGD